MLLFKNLIKSNLLRFLENQRSCNRVIVHTHYQQNEIERNRLYLHRSNKILTFYYPTATTTLPISLLLVVFPFYCYIQYLRCFFLSQNWILVKIFLSIVQEINLVEQRNRLSRHRTLYFTFTIDQSFRIENNSFSFLFQKPKCNGTPSTFLKGLYINPRSHKFPTES